MEGLRSAEGYIRRELAHGLNLRNTPELTFVLDRSIERGVMMSHLIDEVMAGSGSDNGSDDEA
jgi:ribosome-binding factor A